MKISRVKNIKNQRFGRLLVLERAENYIKPSGKAQIAQWLCQCDCGKQIIVRGDHLRGGMVQSCGCYHRECAIEQGKNKKKYNLYDLNGEYGVGYTSNTNEPFYFDLEDYEKIKNYCWSINKDGYILAPKSNKKSNILLHRLIMEPNDDEFIDHIKHNKCDNRKSQLRVVTKSQNAMNSKTPINNSSGTKGVYWNKQREKWQACIKIQGKIIYLGTYDNINLAIQARKQAEEEYFGKYSYENSMKERE